MSTTANDLLDEALAAKDKRAFTDEFLKWAVPFDSGPLDDEETAHAADQLLALLEAEENDTRARQGLALRLGNGREGSPCPGHPVFPSAILIVR